MLGVGCSFATWECCKSGLSDRLVRHKTWSRSVRFFPTVRVVMYRKGKAFVVLQHQDSDHCGCLSFKQLQRLLHLHTTEGKNPNGLFACFLYVALFVVHTYKARGLVERSDQAFSRRVLTTSVPYVHLLDCAPCELRHAFFSDESPLRVQDF